MGRSCLRLNVIGKQCLVRRMFLPFPCSAMRSWSRSSPLLSKGLSQFQKQMVTTYRIEDMRIYLYTLAKRSLVIFEKKKKKTYILFFHDE